MFYKNMYKKVDFFPFICNNCFTVKYGHNPLSENDYKNASLHMRSGFNKYLNNVFISKMG